jgi:hypothetical protein
MILFVVAILALLFIIAITSLVVSNQNREFAHVAVQARNERAIHEAMIQSALLQLRHDIVGDNGRAYDGG